MSDFLINLIFCKNILLALLYSKIFEVVLPKTNTKLNSIKTQQRTISEHFVFWGCIFSWEALREY